MGTVELPTLTGKRVVLRPPRASDVAERMELGAHAEIVRMYGGSVARLGAMTEAAARRWVQDLVDHDYAWVIEADALIGLVRLDRVDLVDRRASLAIGIEDPARLGIGLGSEAIRLILDFAFQELKLHRISVRVIAYNERAIRAYLKCGFVVEGREREAACVDGEWHDDVMMGILEAEYTRMRGQTPGQ